MIFLFLAIAGIAGFAGGRALATRYGRSSWAPVPSLRLRVGGRYRWSTDRVTLSKAQQIADAIALLGAENVLAWEGDEYPNDWPEDDRGTGRARVEATIPANFPTADGFVDFPSARRFRAWELRTA